MTHDEQNQTIDAQEDERQQNGQPEDGQRDNEKAGKEEESSPVTELFKAIGIGISRSTVLCAVLAVLIVAGYFLADSKMAGWRLAAFVALLFITLIALLIYVFKRGTGEQVKENAKALTLPVTVRSSTLDLANTLPDEIKNEIRRVLEYAVMDAAERLSLPQKLVRANIFGVDHHRIMRIPPGFTYNMNRQEELTVAIPVGYGSTGISFAEESPHIAVFREDWGKSVIADHELKKVHPDLRWIISIPVLLTAENGEKKAVWTLNVDGLVEKRTEKQLERVVPNLLPYSGVISLIINKSIGGKEL